ncbi:MAG: tetratricopeptide repeat protein, partial [Bacteroidota bacterium]
MIKARLLFMALLCSMLQLSAQEKQFTGLAALEDESSPPFNRVIEYTNFIWDNLMFSDPDSAYVLLLKAEKFAIEKDETQGLGYIYNNIGVSHGIRGNLAESSSAFRLSSEKLLEAEDYQMYVSVMENLAHSYQQGGLWSKAISTLKKSEEYGEIHQIQYQKDYLNEVYGRVYLGQGNLAAAKRRFFKAITLYNPKKDSIDIGTNYKYLGDIYQKENKIDSAFYFYQKSLNIHQKLSRSNACQTTLSIGQLYFKTGQLEAAKNYLS